MWDDDDDTLEAHTTASQSSKPQAFSLDDAFLEDDGALDAADEFSPAAIRAALARTLAAGQRDSAENQTGDDDEQSTDPGVSNRHTNHDRNGSGKVEDPDASVSTLDINASPVRFPGRAPDDWSRSTSYSRGSGYRQESQDSTGMESLANFSNISLGDSVHDLESVEVSLEPSEEQAVQERGGEEDTGDHDEVPFHAVHIDLSQGGKPRVEEVTAVVSELHIPNRDGARTPSQNARLPPPLPSTSNSNHTYTRSTSTPTSKTFPGHLSQSQSVPDLASPTTDRPPVGDTQTGDETPPNSSGRVVSASSATNPESIQTQGSTVSPPHPSRSESPRRGHRPTRSVGPSTLDKVISKTRPNFLPPKPKTEDLKHMADWEAMMKQSRAVGEFDLC